MAKLPLHTPDLTNENYTALAALFPNAVTETINENGTVIRAIDADVLAQEINTHVVSGKEERYQFTWPDKKKAILLANSPIAATLRPCRDDSVNFDKTENLYIEGDNLDVLKLLRETYLNRVKMIYIDPPYNTGNDLIYKDDFSEDTNKFLTHDNQYDNEGNRMVRNLDSNGRFHTDWLNMIYPRLRVARDLLTDEGVIFISVDDNEIENLRKVCDEIFGTINFQGCILWKKKTNGNNMGVIPPVHDYIIVYSKNNLEVADIGFEVPCDVQVLNYSNPDGDPRGPWDTMDLSANHKGPYFAITNPETSQVHYPPKGRYWVFNESEVQRRIADGRIIFGKSGAAKPVQKVFLNSRGTLKRKAESWWDNHGMNEDATEELTKLFGVPKIFSHPKPTKLLKNIISITVKTGDIIMDFFSGSGTTADAVIQIACEKSLKLQYIMVQSPENLEESLKYADNNAKASLEIAIEFLKNLQKPLLLSEIGKERIRLAGKKIVEESPLDRAELDIGFRVLKLDSSNMKDIYYTPQDTISEAGAWEVDLDGFIDNIKPDRSAEDLLFQVMLDLGIPLSAKIQKKMMGEKTVYFVDPAFPDSSSLTDSHYLIACFVRVTDEIVTEIAKSKPYYAVFRDSSFYNDATLVNFEQIFKTYSPTTIRKVL